METVNDKLKAASALLKIMATVPETIDATIDKRAKEYGEYSKQAGLAQKIKAAIFSTPDLGSGFTPDMAESLDMIATKLSRILCGNPNNPDHWHDIAGYATLIEQRLLKDKGNATNSS